VLLGDVDIDDQVLLGKGWEWFGVGVWFGLDEEFGNWDFVGCCCLDFGLGL
jgi:hypothetical protein